MSALMVAFDALAVHSSSADGAPDIPPTGPPPLQTIFGFLRVLMFVFAAGTAVAVVVFAARTATFVGSWTESITAGPAQKLFTAIVSLILTTSMITVIGWLRGELS